MGLEWIENQLQQQKHRCAVCREKVWAGKYQVDRDCLLGVPRGMVCHKCSIIIGLVDERVGVLENLIKYLTSSNEIC